MMRPAGLRLRITPTEDQSPKELVKWFSSKKQRGTVVVVVVVILSAGHRCNRREENLCGAL